MMTPHPLMIKLGKRSDFQNTVKDYLKSEGANEEDIELLLWELAHVFYLTVTGDIALQSQTKLIT